MSTVLPPLRLKRNEDRRIAAGHQWVFSNEVDTSATPLPAFKAGDVCRIVSDKDKFLGFAYVNPATLICARVLGRDPKFAPGKGLFVHRLQVALALRERLYSKPFYRLIFGESDGLPGLVVDRYGDVVVGQIGTAGMEAFKQEIADAIVQVLKPKAMLWKNDSGARELEGLPAYVEPAFGDVPAVIEVEENGVKFKVSLVDGQKTGWFYDQAANRRAFLKYVKGASVLDVFSYVGSWGLSAAKAGASAITCVDSSASALQLLNDSAGANKLKASTEKGDAFKTMEAMIAAGRKFDIVVIDPPAFIKRKKEIPKGEAAYRRLNQLAMQLLNRDGILVSCSCSYHLSAEALLVAIQKSARHLNRFAQVIEVGGQAPDHPIHPGIEETRYLKTFICRVVTE
ncbi:MAG: class I SAM-dependent rRNA methyltransferase [Candidatus Obscuribacterales bacterium]|nr:class I SAM-dependent rRNA methyltransferase [Steroidobacteraceae bacterium]